MALERSSVKQTDRGWRALGGKMRKNARGPNVRVGIQGTEAAEERGFEETNASLALIHEFGSQDGTIPSRPFMRGTVNREKRQIEKLLGNAARRSVLPGSRLERELGIVGEWVRSKMIQTINLSIGIKPNADITIERKGSTTPLIDTGVLKNAITWEVRLR